MRGFKKVYMVTILEGDGVDEAFREVKYFYDDENDTLIGILDQLTPPQSHGELTPFHPRGK